jgi:hypothetical protein
VLCKSWKFLLADGDATSTLESRSGKSLDRWLHKGHLVKITSQHAMQWRQAMELDAKKTGARMHAPFATVHVEELVLMGRFVIK